MLAQWALRDRRDHLETQDHLHNEATVESKVSQDYQALKVPQGPWAQQDPKDSLDHGVMMALRDNQGKGENKVLKAHQASLDRQGQ